jgi:MiaB/RimO family radical SAM methylthiotransferase
MAERYGKELAEALPEADAILGFDDYKDISAKLQSILAGNSHISHTPQDRRALLPISPVDRATVRAEVKSTEVRNAEHTSAVGAGGSLFRKRLGNAPWAPLKIASGCDRRCSFCAIPYFRGSFVSRPAAEILEEAGWLANHGVSELFLVSENTTSYGKDLGDMNLLEALLPALSSIEKIERIRVSYLQPAEMRPQLINAIVNTEKVVPYFDLSLQHVSKEHLRRMRRWGDKDRFLERIARIRSIEPNATFRSNFIVGYPGETEEDHDQLLDFVQEAQLDWCGFFSFSPEDGTHALSLPNHVEESLMNERLAELREMQDNITAERRDALLGETIQVLVDEPGIARSFREAPEIDGVVQVPETLEVGRFHSVVVEQAFGPDLIAVPVEAHNAR